MTKQAEQSSEETNKQPVATVPAHWQSASEPWKQYYKVLSERVKTVRNSIQNK